MALFDTIARATLNSILSDPATRAGKVKELSRILKEQGLGNNNTKRAEAAEAIICSFTGQAPAEAPEIEGKSPIAKR